MTSLIIIKKWTIIIALIIGVSLVSCSAENEVYSGNSLGAPSSGSRNSNSKNGGGSKVGSGQGVNVSTGAESNEFVLDPNICAGANVQASRVKPTVLFVVDRSGSMEEEYPGSTNRWQAIYDALMDSEDGVIPKLQSVVYFGMVLFDGPMEGMAIEITNAVFCMIPGMPCDTSDGGQTNEEMGCPRLVVVDPALENFSAIEASYQPSGPGGSTPTALSLEAAYDLINAADQDILDHEVHGQPIVILCTDGLPNGCADTLNVPDQQGPIDQLTAAAQKGIKTYVVGVAADDEAQAYLDKLAQYGDTGQPAFSPATKHDLVVALSQIVGGAVGCNVVLNGAVVPGIECEGTVMLNGELLECNGPDGWRLVNESEIELQGSACQKFIDDPAVIISASFPCEAFILE